jgi:hypothetical protein
LAHGTLFVELEENGNPTAARVELTDAEGAKRYPEGTIPYEKDSHFTARGSFSADLPAGETVLTVEKGKEYVSLSDRFEVPPGSEIRKVYHLDRWIDMAGLGWFSGDTHVHRNPEEIVHLMDADDLNVAPIISYWNQEWQIDAGEIRGRIFREGSRAYSTMTQEDERGGGAVMALNLPVPVVTDTDRWYPSQAMLLESWRRQGAMIEQEKPFWWEAPVNVALGLVDTMGVVNNHLLRKEIMANEAWGRGRDTKEYPGEMGFVHYVLDLYYRYLNLGLKIPLAAGSASGVMRSPIGQNRLYVNLGPGGFDYRGWFEGMKEGRAFATNGPMLIYEPEGLSGPMTISMSGAAEVEFPIKVLSSTGIDRLELVRNGMVVDKVDGDGLLEVDAVLREPADESSWFAARAFESGNQFRFAHSNPVFVEVGDPITPSREDALYYSEWCAELLEQSKGDEDRYRSQGQRKEVEGIYREARSFYMELAARCEGPKD